MKNWFKNLNRKTKKILIFSLLVIGIIFCLLANYNYYIAILGLIFLVPALIFFAWYIKDKKNLKSQKNSKNKKLEVPIESTQSTNNSDFIAKSQPKTSPQTEIIYSLPEGYELVDWTYTITKVRGCQYYIDEDSEINVDDEVEIIHEPKDKYPENTCIYINNEQVGSLKQDMAIDWYQTFGSHYKLIGTVVEYEVGEYPRLIIDIKRPIIRKIKK